MTISDKFPMVDNDHDLCNLLKANDRVMALFYASWCPFCISILTLFKKYGEGGHLPDCVKR